MYGCPTLYECLPALDHGFAAVSGSERNLLGNQPDADGLATRPGRDCRHMKRKKVEAVFLSFSSSYVHAFTAKTLPRGPSDSS